MRSLRVSMRYVLRLGEILLTLIMAQPEEMEEWRSKPSTALVFDPDDHEGHPIPTYAVPGRVLSCFSAARALANLTGRVIHQFYAIRAGPNRLAESVRVEEALDKWYMDLPAHLQVDATAAATAPSLPPPQILSLHLSYWCTVILLHRPLFVFLIIKRFA